MFSFLKRKYDEIKQNPLGAYKNAVSSATNTAMKGISPMYGVASTGLNTASNLYSQKENAYQQNQKANFNLAQAKEQAGVIDQRYNQMMQQKQQPPANARFSAASAFQSPMGDFSQRLRDIQQRRQQAINDSAQNQANRLEQMKNLQQDRLKAQIPGLENRLNNYKANAQQSIENFGADTEAYKQQVRNQQGEAMRRAAQTNRENQQGLQNMFAGLNTLDSSVFQNQAAKQANDFTRNQNTRLQDQANMLNEADRNFLAAKQEAKLRVDDEIERFNESVREIEYLAAQGLVDFDTAIADAYNQAQQSILGIEEGLANSEAQAQMAYQQMQMEGNQDGSPSNKIKTEAVGVIDQLLNSNLGQISGLGQYNPLNMIPGAEAQTTKALYDQLKGQLALINREYLKGTGTVTDYEAKIALEAAAALNQNLSPEQMQRVLMDLKQKLALETGMPSNVAGATVDNNDPLGIL